jgi:hypothetical protein
MIEFLNSIDPTLAILGLIGTFTLFFAGIPLGIMLWVTNEPKSSVIVRAIMFPVSLAVLLAGVKIFLMGYGDMHPSKYWIVFWMFCIFSVPSVINMVFAFIPLDRFREAARGTVLQLFLFTLVIGLILPVLGLIKYMDQLAFWTNP